MSVMLKLWNKPDFLAAIGHTSNGKAAAGPAAQTNGVHNPSADGSAAPPRADANVTGIQKAMKKLGFYSGPANGIMSDKTQDAIKAFQEANDVRPSGQMDKPTRTALAMALRGAGVVAVPSDGSASVIPVANGRGDVADADTPLPATPVLGAGPVDHAGPQERVLVGIIITPAETTILDEGTQAFSAFGEYGDHTSGDDLTYDVEWSSSSPAVTIEPHTGLATAHAPTGGVASATITAKHRDASVRPGTAKVTVTFKPSSPPPPPPAPAQPHLQLIRIEPDKASVFLEKTVGFKATGDYADGQQRNLTDQVEWNFFSLAPDPVLLAPSIIQDSAIFRAIGVGNATITAKLAGSGVPPASATLTVNPAPTPPAPTPPAPPTPPAHVQKPVKDSVTKDADEKNNKPAAPADDVLWGDVLDIFCKNVSQLANLTGVATRVELSRELKSTGNANADKLLGKALEALRLSHEVDTVAKARQIWSATEPALLALIAKTIPVLESSRRDTSSAVTARELISKTIGNQIRYANPDGQLAQKKTPYGPISYDTRDESTAAPLIATMLKAYEAAKTQYQALAKPLHDADSAHKKVISMVSQRDIAKEIKENKPVEAVLSEEDFNTASRLAESVKNQLEGIHDSLIITQKQQGLAVMKLNTDDLADEAAEVRAQAQKQQATVDYVTSTCGSMIEIMSAKNPAGAIKAVYDIAQSTIKYFHKNETLKEAEALDARVAALRKGEHVAELAIVKESLKNTLKSLESTSTLAAQIQDDYGRKRDGAEGFYDDKMEKDKKKNSGATFRFSVIRDALATVSEALTTANQVNSSTNAAWHSVLAVQPYAFDLPAAFGLAETWHKSAAESAKDLDATVKQLNDLRDTANKAMLNSRGH